MAQQNLKRRSLLRVTALGAGAAVASGAVGRQQALASYGQVPNLAGKTAIVIGSGFGGAVAAYRLGQAGVQTTVLERGSEGRAGVIATHRGDGINVLSGVGVGGSSLVMGMSMSQPRRSEWDQVYPAELPFDVMDQTYWPRARQNLNATLVPAEIQPAWRATVAEFGKTPVPVPFAKDSVDRNYLAWAAATGNVIVQPLHEVTEIHEISGQDGFEVRCKQINEHGDVLATKTFTCDYLFMAAGTVYTSSLLVTARARGWLPRLRATVGKGFGNNGDFLVVRLKLRKDAGSAQSTPGTVKFYDDNNPFAVAAMAFESAPSWTGKASAHLITSMAPERGEIRFDPVSGTGKVYWPYGVMETKGEKAGRDLATRLWWETEGKKGRLLNGLPNYDRNAGHGFGAANTWHPLGGMVMGQSTDFNGRSLDYNNLYCVDGSLLPGTACLADPPLTITANAERCLDSFIAAHA
ncbi:MAG TPA: cholesterol oxidase [Micromonosporaceae bacterium]|nr:cholesterol oxidase [Micromonosporaceae bacterium]